jgi:hypothetical protein
MIKEKTFLLVTVLLVAVVCIAGCTVNVGAPTPTATPTTIQTLPPSTTAQPTTVTVTTTIVTTAATTAPAGKEVLHEKGILTTKTFKTYDFKTLMGYKFLYPKDKFKITIKSEKPVLCYAVNTEQAGQLAGLIPRYQSYVKGGIDWGLIEPVMVIEKATDTTKEFTLQDDIRPLTYVVDGRWMGYDSSYDNTAPFNYEITIVKTGGPTEQNFDFG